MNDIIFLIQENESELLEKIRKECNGVIELKDSNFDGDSSIIALLITITPIIVTQLGEVIKTLIQNPSKGKIKINGIEIEGFTYDETIKLLNKFSGENDEDEQ